MGLRVLMLAWEYPPRLVGGLARVVCAVSRQLVKQGCEVHVITAGYDGAQEYALDEGVHVHRAMTQTGTDGCELKTPDFLTWDARLNFGILQYAIKLHQEKPFDIVHAHDWLVADAAWVMKSFGLPLIANIHATEFGRNHGGLQNDSSRYIDTIEWRLIYESTRVIVNSRHMLTELTEHFHVPAEKVEIIPNGIDPDRLKSEYDESVLRQQHALGDGPVVLFVGRLVHEKGIQILLQAAPLILANHPDTTFLIAGTGYFEEELRRTADERGITERVRFFGQANDSDLSELYAMADALVVPSLYEPFGIVALEGMANRVPTITSDSGGLIDIIEHMCNGVTTFAGNPESLAWGVLQVLDNAELADQLSERAREHVVSNFSWEAITARTLQAYHAVVAINSVPEEIVKSFDEVAVR